MHSSTDGSDEKSWQQNPDVIKLENPAAQVAETQSETCGPVHSSHDCTEFTPETDRVLGMQAPVVAQVSMFTTAQGSSGEHILASASNATVHETHFPSAKELGTDPIAHVAEEQSAFCSPVHSLHTSTDGTSA